MKPGDIPPARLLRIALTVSSIHKLACPRPVEGPLQNSTASRVDRTRAVPLSISPKGLRRNVPAQNVNVPPFEFLLKDFRPRRIDRAL